MEYILCIIYIYINIYPEKRQQISDDLKLI